MHTHAHARTQTPPPKKKNPNPQPPAQLVRPAEFHAEASQLLEDAEKAQV
jgi:hypothetical protein